MRPPQPLPIVRPRPRPRVAYLFVVFMLFCLLGIYIAVGLCGYIVVV